jgi:hypothetical protein
MVSIRAPSVMWWSATALRPFFPKLGIALFQAITHLVRLHLLLVEDFAHRALRQIGQAHMPLGGPVRAGVAGEKSRCPQFVRIAQIPRLTAGEINQPSLGLDRDEGLATSPRAIIERRQGAFDHGALDTALDGLMMQPERLAHCKKGRVLPIRQQNARPFNPVAGSVRDCDIAFSFATSASSSDNSIARRHAAISGPILRSKPRAANI